MNMNDVSLSARILSADLARGCNWQHPKRVQGCGHIPRLRGFLVGSTLVLTSLLTSVAHAGGLADAVAAAYGKSATSVTAARKAAPRASQAPKRAPVCGAWVELHQGRGKGRTCEAGAL